MYGGTFIVYGVCMLVYTVFFVRALCFYARMRMSFKLRVILIN